MYVSILKDSRCEILVGLGGFEPPTSPLSGVRSNQLSYRPGILQPVSDQITCEDARINALSIS